MERMAHSLVKAGLFGFENLDQALAADADRSRPKASIRRPSRRTSTSSSDDRRRKPKRCSVTSSRAAGRSSGIQLDDTIAKAKFSHPHGGEVTIEWDIERAKKAGLLGKQGDM